MQSSSSLHRRQARGAQAVATGNIGCMTQLKAQLEQKRQPLPVYPTIQLLDRAYRGV